jgi:3-oxoacyl-[acyl-carrier protein] reductase|tara:strand:+ start:2465 stop:3208 length:744 start_codon:yes stop_codon:yes gene_type:complete
LKFKDKVALITGAYQGLGKGIAKRLGAQGCKLILVDIDERVKDTEKEFNNANIDAISVIGDVSEESTANSAVEKGVSKYNKIDILVNNAGIGGINKPLWDLPVDELDRVYAINLRGVFIFCKSVIPLMLKNKYGRIVNIASIAGKEGNPNAVPYSATKSAVIGLTKSLGKELAKTEIRVNCVTPAVVKTSILDEFTEEHINYMLEKIPIGRTGKIEEVANMVAWIASEECSFSTGAVFDISGGRATY